MLFRDLIGRDIYSSIPYKSRKTKVCAPMLFEDIGRLLDAQALGLRVEEVDGDGHDDAHAPKEEEQPPAHGAQHGQIRLHTQK